MPFLCKNSEGGISPIGCHQSISRFFSRFAHSSLVPPTTLATLTRIKFVNNEIEQFCTQERLRKASKTNYAAMCGSLVEPYLEIGCQHKKSACTKCSSYSKRQRRYERRERRRKRKERMKKRKFFRARKVSKKQRSSRLSKKEERKNKMEQRRKTRRRNRCQKEPVLPAIRRGIILQIVQTLRLEFVQLKQWDSMQ